MPRLESSDPNQVRAGTVDIVNTVMVRTDQPDTLGDIALNLARISKLPSTIKSVTYWSVGPGQANFTKGFIDQIRDWLDGSESGTGHYSLSNRAIHIFNTPLGLKKVGWIGLYQVLMHELKHHKQHQQYGRLRMEASSLFPQFIEKEANRYADKKTRKLATAVSGIEHDGDGLTFSDRQKEALFRTPDGLARLAKDVK